MSEMQNERVTVSVEMQINASVERIWPQLCPVREYDWIEMWDCAVLHSDSGYNELGCVFTTDFPAEYGEEVWLTSRFDVNERLEFVRTNSTRIIHFCIELAPNATGTRLTWTQHVTALNQRGNQYVADKPEAFTAQMAVVKHMLEHYLETGDMLMGKDPGILEGAKAHVHHRTTG